VAVVAQAAAGAMAMAAAAAEEEEEEWEAAESAVVWARQVLEPSPGA